MPRITFIVGAGRSGSSILHELLGYHPGVGWMSRLCDSKPQNPRANRQMLALIRLPVVGHLLRGRYEPIESYRFFNVSYPGFGMPMRDLRRSDVTAEAAREIRHRLPAVVPPDRRALIVKITGWPRIGFLAELFPEARFVHLIRDGRAVAASLLRVPWWHGWRGPANWRFGPLPVEYREEWEAHDRSFSALAAIEWKLVTDALEASRDEVEAEQLMDVRYEDLCSDSEQTMCRILEHAGLAWSDALGRAMDRHPLRNQNTKWRGELGPGNAAIVEAVLQNVLPRYGYTSGES